MQIRLKPLLARLATVPRRVTRLSELRLFARRSELGLVFAGIVVGLTSGWRSLP